MKPVKIMLDTDIGGDCDDSGALALLNELARNGDCEILSVTHCFEGNSYAGCIDAINRYYGRLDIPIGAFPPNGGSREAGQIVYSAGVAERFPNRFSEGEDCPHTVEVLRRTLAQAADGEVVFVAIGPLCSMKALLESGPDEISELSGEELARRRITRTVIMGGRFHNRWPETIAFGDGYVVDAEYNIKGDIPAAQAVCERWPGEIIFCSYEIGNRLITGARLQTEGYPDNPVAFAYTLWHQKTKVPGLGRESWDLATVLFAVRPDDGLWELHPYGKITVDDQGVTRWSEASEGRHTFMIEKVPIEEARAAIDGWLERDLGRNGK